MNRITWVDEPHTSACKVCGSRGDGSLVAVVHPNSGADIEAVRCPECGSIDLVDDAQNGASTDADIDDYIEAGAGLSAIASAFDGIDPNRVARFLDVGCSYGFALDIARFTFGWTVVGVEGSPAGRRGAAELDLDIRPEFLTASTKLGEPFDLILASEVVEHVVDPLEFLTAVRRQLAATGTLVLTTPAAEVVTPSSPDVDALCAVSPGFHTFVATQEALEQLLRRAGFRLVRVVRDGGTLRARASLGVPLDGGDVSAVGREGVERYLGYRMATAPPDSALAVGMAVRLIRDLVAQGRLDAADDVAHIVRSAFHERHHVDLGEPAELLAQVVDGRRLPWSSVGACFALGSLELQLHNRPERAADYFALTVRLAEFWSQELTTVDLTLADLRFQGAYHRALAQTRFAPREAVLSAFHLHEHLSESIPNRDDIFDTSLCRLFVELIAQGHHSDVGALQEHVQAIAGMTGRSEDDEARTAGLDALYSLGVFHRDLGDDARAQAAFIECIGICESRPSGDQHAAQLSELCRANLPQAARKESAPVKRSVSSRLRLRRRRAATRGSNAAVAASIDTFWSDTWGTYLDGWVRLDDVHVRQVVVEAGGISVVAAPHERPDLDDRHTTFAAYLPRHAVGPITLILRTADGEVTTEVTLPETPRPEHPATPPSIPDRRLQRAMKQAPDGPALAMGVRSLSAELAKGRISLIENREVIGLDIHPGHGVDVVGDVHQLSSIFPANHFSVVYSAALLEHVAAPWLVAAECAKVLKPGGIAVHIAPWVWPTHSQPNDFWRFSDRGLASLFHESLGFRVLDCGGIGGAVITPTPDWRLDQLRFPTYSSPAMSWVIAEKVAEPDATVSWPYGDKDVVTAQEYPVDGLCDSGVVTP